MSIAHVKLTGLNKERILEMVEPILARHEVDGVELVWQGSDEGQILLVTIELPGAVRTGEGITVDICSAISRDISLVLDESELISPAYRLEVSSPGVERQLYLREDYVRFSGQGVKVKLKEPIDSGDLTGQSTVRGTLLGLESDDVVTLDTDHGAIKFPLDMISNARLIFNWNQSKRSARRPSAGAKRRPTKKGAKRPNKIERSNENGRR